MAIPVRDGGPLLERVLGAVRDQTLTPGTAGPSGTGAPSEIELIVCDSGSRDGSPAAARRQGAQVIEIPPAAFSHGATRNLLMERSHGDRVAFLTQDAVPAGPGWLAALLGGFALAEDVGLVFGPYRPRLGASPMVARELDAWFHSFSPGGQPRIDRLAPGERGAPGRALLGQRGFFTDVNGCLARAAWEQVRFREVAYAEDHWLAHDMLRAGLAKVYVPAAAVIHSHDYPLRGWLRRSFDEARAMQELYGWTGPAGVRATALGLWGSVGADWRFAGRPRRHAVSLLARSGAHHLARATGAALGARAGALDPRLARLLSLEGRDL